MIETAAERDAREAAVREQLAERHPGWTLRRLFGVWVAIPPGVEVVTAATAEIALAKLDQAAERRQREQAARLAGHGIPH